MAENFKNPITCLNGHEQKVTGSRFCIHCGVALNVQPVQPNQPPVQNNQQWNQFGASPQMPVSEPPPKFIQPETPTNSHNYQQGNPNYQQGNSNFPQQNPYHQNYQQQPNIPPQINQPYQQIQPAQYVQQIPNHVIQALECYTCGGNGQGLDAKVIICKECNWLRPLFPGYRIDSSAFAWAADAKAMAALRAITPLDMAAKKVSEMVGRRWIESTFNSILLGEKQLPHIYAQAVKAARVIGMTHMPDIYISGERSWDCLTFGTEKDAFIVIGSAIAGNFQGPDMFFLLAREMGHCHAGHALWKSVVRFLMGEQSQSKGFMAGGIMNALKGGAGGLVAGVIEVPLLAWARQAEITADRAGLLCINDQEIARRVLISWSLKSSFLFKQINIEEWLRQQAENEDDGYSKLSELTTSSTPYLSRRLKLLSDYAKSPELQHWQKMIAAALKHNEPSHPQAKPTLSAKPAESSNVVKLKCATCQNPMQVPLKILAGKTELPVKCPKCGKITRLKKSVKPAEKAPDTPMPKIKNEENLNYGD